MVTHELREGAVIACGHPQAMDSGGWCARLWALVVVSGWRWWALVVVRGWWWAFVVVRGWALVAVCGFGAVIGHGRSLPFWGSCW